MTKINRKQMQADWAATKNIVGFQELLKNETDDGRYSILSQLLSDEFAKFKPQAEAPRPDPKSAIVNLGNPVTGLVLGALVIAATMGSFLLWDNYQGGADAKTAISMGLQ